MAQYHNRRRVTDEERRTLLKALGVAGTAGIVGELTLGELRGEVATETGGELAEMGQAIRSDLSGKVEADLLASGLSGLAGSIEQLPALEAAGLPAEQGTAYQSLTDGVWPAHEHLAEVGFFASAERHLPPFVPEHISASARQLIGTGSLAGALSELGFGQTELVALAVMVVNNNAHLAKWKPTGVYAEQGVEEFNPADIAPLHQRAAEGSLLWIDGLDHWLWQNRVLLTEELLAAGIWDVKAMLGGYSLLARAARDVAEGSISDEVLSAMVTTGTAVSIISQEQLAFDLVRVSDEDRAPRGGS